MSQASVDPSPSAEALLGRVADEFTDRLQRGEHPEIEEYADRHPEIADVLRQVLPALLVIGSSAGAGQVGEPVEDAGNELTGTLGDFRIVRQVGRGGMGIVYEAEQLSLGRRVALKVLPLASTLDARHLQRFKNEAQAAAHLQHQNIVPVYYVGCDRGVHYYAMQFIDGHSLAEVIDRLRWERGGRSQDPEATTGYTGKPPAPAAEPPNGTPAGPGTQAEAAAQAETVSATPGSGLSPAAYFAWVARLGEQAALGLEHAHQQGVLHRDIKPANLLLDGRDNVWITDFGLAHLPGDQRLTMTGDLLGTLRYMSPELALAQRVPVDPRTDVYSLGVTLYELLTLQPAYRGKDRQELLRQIAFEEAKAPRRLDRAIPAELETIVLKAMAKVTDERYATAQDLADDLRHWLEDRPIRARRPSLVLRLRRWGRRHRTLVAASLAAGMAGVIVLAASLGWTMHERATRRTEAAKVIEAALAESAQLQERGRLPEAMSAAERARSLRAGRDVDAAVAERVERRWGDLQLVYRLHQIRIENSPAVKTGPGDPKDVDRQYVKAWCGADLDIEALPVEEAAARIRATSVPVELASVLDHWVLIRRAIPGLPRTRWQSLLRVAVLSDPDGWRTRVRQALMANDRPALRRLAASADATRLSPVTLSVLLAALFSDPDALQVTETLLLATHREYPGDFWINYQAYDFLVNRVRPSRPADAVRFAMAAAALRPDSADAREILAVTLDEAGHRDQAIAEYRRLIGRKQDIAVTHYNLGYSLYQKGLLDEAIAEFRHVIQLKKDFGNIHTKLAVALHDKGRLDEAIAEFRVAARLRPESLVDRRNLAITLAQAGRLDEAIAEYHQAIRLKQDSAALRNDLGCVLLLRRHLDEAIAEFRHAIQLNNGIAEVHNNLGKALRDKSQLAAAITEYRHAIQLKKDYPEAHYGLGNALRDKGLLDEAIAEFRQAIQLKDDSAEAHSSLGNALHDKGQLAAAITEYRRAIRLKKDFPEAHYGLGNALRDEGLLDEAVAEYRQAIRLKDDYAKAHCNLGVTLYQKGLLNEAIAEQRYAIRLQKDSAKAHFNLAIALWRQGRFHEAATEMRHGHELGAHNPRWRYPTAQWLQELETMAYLDERLPDFLTGRTQPKDSGEQLVLARLCQQRARPLYAASARWYADAFTSDPKLADDMIARHRYNGACAAALAGCGKGNDAAQLGDTERTRLRRQALVWLRADLAAWQQRLHQAPIKNRTAILQVVQHWQRDTDLAGVRDVAAIKKFPQVEQADWQRLWKDLETLKQRCLRTTASGS